MLSIILTFLALPLGLLLIIKEQKDDKKYQAIFDDFLEKTQRSSFSHQMKMAKLRAMLEHNYYHILVVDTDEIQAERKLFSMGWLIFSLGFLYIGALAYILYFYKFKKPHKIHFFLK